MACVGCNYAASYGCIKNSVATLESEVRFANIAPLSQFGRLAFGEKLSLRHHISDRNAGLSQRFQRVEQLMYDDWCQPQRQFVDDEYSRVRHQSARLPASAARRQKSAGNLSAAVFQPRKQREHFA